MDAQCKEGTVYAENVQDIADFNRLGVLAGGIADVALLSPEVVQQAEHEADGSADGGADAESSAGIAVLCQQLGHDDHGDDVADHTAEAAGAGQGSALAVGVSHSGQQGTHGDVEHRVEAFVQDFAEEQHDQHRGTLKEGGYGPENDKADGYHGGRAQQPRTELAVFVVLFCKDLVHQSAHQRVVDGVPDVPDQQQGGKHHCVDLQNVGVVTGNDGTHQGEGHAAAHVAEGVTDFMLHAQSAGSFCFCHNFLLKI